MFHATTTSETDRAGALTVCRGCSVARRAPQAKPLHVCSARRIAALIIIVARAQAQDSSQERTRERAMPP